MIMMRPCVLSGDHEPQDMITAWRAGGRGVGGEVWGYLYAFD
jgi:hypothetical protein